MSILTRFKDIMASNINALLDKAEDPEKMIDQYLRNLNRDLGNVKAGLHRLWLKSKGQNESWLSVKAISRKWRSMQLKR